ncbi:glycosyltransferase [Nonomuraea ferruginea]
MSGAGRRCPARSRSSTRAWTPSSRPPSLAREEWARLLDSGPHVHAIPDALPGSPWPRSRMDNRIVAAGGRWVAAKSYDRLIRAFAVVSAERPDWRLRLYGSGPEERRLRALVDELGLHNHVYFMGTTPDLTGEFAKASIVANTSHTADLGMTVLEAMGCGVPVVAFEGTHGPAEFVATGYNGVLVPEADERAFAGAMLALIGDERRRRSLAAGALDTAIRHAADEVGEQWEKLFAGLR